MILYNRKKVKYRKDGYCWKKRKDGKTTREDHMKLKVQGVEVRGCRGTTSRWSFGTEYGFTACVVLNLLSFTAWRHAYHADAHTNTHAENLQANTLPASKWFLSLSRFLSLSLPNSPLSLSVSLSF